jgi:hypothetical protein
MSDDGETRQLKRFGKWAAIGALAVVVLGIGVRASNRYSQSPSPRTMRCRPSP